jgi:hypothetical protein
MLFKEIKNWAKIEFNTALDNIEFDEKIKQELRNSVFFQSVNNKKINGQSVEKIKGINEGNFGINMSEVFHQCALKSEENLPILFLLELTKIINKKYGDNSDKLSGILGRSYRSFPSFIRDYDAKEKLSTYFTEIIIPDIQFVLAQDSELDSKEHADISVKCIIKNEKEILFYVWLYQYTDRSIVNIQDRLIGDRGILPNGIHILVPLRTEILKNYNQLKNGLIRKQHFLSNWKEQLLNKKNSITKKQEIESKIQKYEEEVTDYRDKIKKIELEEGINLKRISEIEQWILFSKDYLDEIGKDIVKIVQKKIGSIPDYEILKDAIEKPRKLLSSKYMFQKSTDL